MRWTGLTRRIIGCWRQWTLFKNTSGASFNDTSFAWIFSSSFASVQLRTGDDRADQVAVVAATDAGCRAAAGGRGLLVKWTSELCGAQSV